MKGGLADRANLARLLDSRVNLLLAVAVLLLLLAIGSAVATLRSVKEDTDWVEHTLAAQSSINRLSALNERLETARRGHLLQPSADFVTILKVTQDSFDREEVVLSDLIADNTRQLARMREIAKTNARRKLIIEDNLLTPATALAVAEGNLDKEQGTLATRHIRALTQEMADTEARLLSIRNQRQLSSLVQLYLVGGALLLIVFGILATALVLMIRTNRRLSRAEVKLRGANEGLERAVAARTVELTRANQEIQRFAYIVSHDLRSPLVNVLGFTSELEMARKDIRKFLEELFQAHPDLRDETVWTAVDQDLPEATGFIRTSTEKMDRLINSILELSRQGRRTLTPVNLPMDQLAADVLASLHQSVEDAGATVSVDPLPDLVSDRLAVEQILSNLVENALKYRSPARKPEIRLSGGVGSGRVHIDVSDNGRGIDPADHERIFELFRRSGPQDQAGEGIGLANVRALAYRLGGTISVESQLDQGARFRLSLPQQFQSLETVA